MNGNDEEIVVAPAGNYASAGFGGAAGPDNETIFKQLRSQGFPKGLIEQLLLNTKAIPLRIWIVDNSGSMTYDDGQCIIDDKTIRNGLKLVPCTRWKEIVETVQYHARLSGLLQAATIFRLLNDPGAAVGPQQFSIGVNGPASIDGEVHEAVAIMKRAMPISVTPLVRHMREICAQVKDMAPQLMKNGQKVAIIVATDGSPSDVDSKQQFVDVLKEFDDLPVYIVFRLCTDNSSVVDYYGDIDKQLESPVEVLDDFVAEAEEIVRVNPWLNYSLPLHRCRELGFYHQTFDLIDERRFLKDEIATFCSLLLGEKEMLGAPDPLGDFEGFLEHVNLVTVRDENGHQWNPIKKKVLPLINDRELRKSHGDAAAAGDGCCIVS
eukprot:CAMPEP_0116006106 /NCGR_PEP_ID=MMETSP0321-20121206/1537_1 /TAXON_ID=163516 /ORGANISM="Leptocylindrus danicus var. danicus, Strain B650" /LENGTH=378 /DNA_ID=CAMNT_0003474609 /DNA_START=131 /DNA_END=1267 /DNA_ORIENTATION=+